MQKIIIEKPYKFSPPNRRDLWLTLVQRFRLYEPHLRKNEGVVSHECRNVERLRASLDAGHGILLAPNHCRTADPIVIGWLAKQARTHVFGMASWHLFNQSRLMTWCLRRIGAFSVYREGIDRQAMNTSIEILETAARPLIIFPEGAVSRTNDRLHAMYDISFIARAAAKKRAKRDPALRVVVHPVAIKYFFRGDLDSQADTVLSAIESRLSWRPQSQLPLMNRIGKLGRALLCLKELEYFGQVQSGTLAERLRGLIDRLLCPLEQEWLGASHSGPVVPRVKALRIKILPELIEGSLEEAERARRWEQLADIYLAQQVGSYPPDYIEEKPSLDRLLETIERFEEDLTDKVTVHGDLHCVLSVGEPISVSTGRNRGNDADPIMVQLEQQLQAMLDELAVESPRYPLAGD